jgi:hypothetical protein
MAFTRKFLGEIYNGCGGRCYYCGTEIPPFSHWEPDHMLPKSQGGSDDLSNLALACRRCNRSKGKRTVEEFRSALIERIEERISTVAMLCSDLPDFLNSTEAKNLGRHLEHAWNWASVILPIFYGEANDLPRDAYDPYRYKTLDVSALDDPALELDSFEEAYLRLKKYGSSGTPAQREQAGWSNE